MPVSRDMAIFVLTTTTTTMTGPITLPLAHARGVKSRKVSSLLGPPKAAFSAIPSILFNILISVLFYLH